MLVDITILVQVVHAVLCDKGRDWNRKPEASHVSVLKNNIIIKFFVDGSKKIAY